MAVTTPIEALGQSLQPVGQGLALLGTIITIAIIIGIILVIILGIVIYRWITGKKPIRNKKGFFERTIGYRFTSWWSKVLAGIVGLFLLLILILIIQGC